MKNRKITILSGAGISAESGIKTFRDSNGLWNNHDIMEVASPIGWKSNPKLVLEFYNQRRRQLLNVKPNKAHYAITELQKCFSLKVITQNVDDLHERAGAENVLHLHGELLKVRSEKNDKLIYEWKKDLNIGDYAEDGEQLRPHIVWFGEQVPMISFASEIISNTDILIIIGTSMQVYPAAGLINYLNQNSKIYYIDPKPSGLYTDRYVEIIKKNASEGMENLANNLINEYCK